MKYNCYYPSNIEYLQPYWNEVKQEIGCYHPSNIEYLQPFFTEVSQAYVVITLQI